MNRKAIKIVAVVALIGASLFGIREGLSWVYQRGMNVGYAIGHEDAERECSEAKP